MEPHPLFVSYIKACVDYSRGVVWKPDSEAQPGTNLKVVGQAETRKLAVKKKMKM